MSVAFCLLGDIEVRADGRVVDVGHARQRCVLAVLLAEANRVVPASELVGRVWGEGRLPADPVATLQTYVSLLRRALSGVDGVALVRQAPGYKVAADPGSVDVNRFQSLLGQARAARDGAAGYLAEALGLWRGEAFAGLDTPWINAARAALRHQRRDALLELSAIQLRNGENAASLAALAGWVAEDPLDERLAAQYLTALYRSGRPAAALEHYEMMRQRLSRDLGTLPGPGLQRIHQQILRADVRLLTGPPGPGPAGPGRQPGDQRGAAIPRELPPDVPGFTGRTRELAELDRLVRGMTGSAGNVAVVSGTAGAGKTALAVRWAHRARHRFPDGQLHVDLRGYDPGQPLPAADALAGFLRSLGVASQDIPAGLDERARRFRTLMSGRRMLVVADNACSAAQARPLLPGTPSCAVLITSRDSLAGLVARDGAHRLDLGPLPAGDAGALLRGLLGGRAASDTRATGTLAHHCCRLPLALRAAAELALSRPADPLGLVAEELADQQRRLDLLDSGGDPHTCVRAVFSWSRRHLPAAADRAFRLLGLHPGPHLDVFTTAALAGTTLADARQLTSVLTRANLIQPAGQGRYTMHDLLRGYARDLACQDGEQAVHDALTRLFDYYLAAATAAADILIPAPRHRRPRVPRPAVPLPAMTDTATARSWLHSERAALTQVTAHCAAAGWPGHAIQLALTLSCCPSPGGRHSGATTIEYQASDAPGRGPASHRGDRAACVM